MNSSAVSETGVSPGRSIHHPPTADPSTWGSRLSADRTIVSFSVFAPRATRIEVWIYATSLQENTILRRQLLIQSEGSRYAQVAVADLQAAGLVDQIYYGYRAWGPNWTFDSAWQPGSAAGFLSDVDAQGNRFNPNKLLIDPYALEVSHDPLTVAHSDPTAYLSGPVSRLIDTAPFAPKSMVLDVPDPAFGVKPSRAFKDEIIYEVHLRGLTKNDTSVPPALRGTYAGAALRAHYLRDLGVSAVEFQPVHETGNSLNDVPGLASLHNYWGYDSFSYFAPDRRYAHDQSPGGPSREWIAMVKAYHDVGLKVYVDVVYNHFDESNVDAATGSVGEIFSLRGLDNTSYYEIASPSNANQYENDNGVGPNVNAASLAVRNLVLDSLKYWTNVMGADGFRFDLAAILGNGNPQGGYRFDRDGAENILNRTVAELPARPPNGGPGIDLIAEPYTANGAGQEQGNFPVGWSEWNDRFRDVFRASQNKLDILPITPGSMATRFAGSDDLFRSRGRKPWNSVNYISCHDGFTLRDLYYFRQPMNNQPFPFGPSSGGRSANDEMCWDHGADPGQQMQAVRTGLALLLLSAGTPMISGGSEFFRTQFGNNNAYNLDTVANWFDWKSAAQQSALTAYTRNLMLFRRAHPCLRPADFFTGTDHSGNGLKDLTWYFDSGAEVSQDYFANPDNHFLAYRLDGTQFGDPSPSIYVAYNGWSQSIVVNVPAPLPGNNWFLVTDTSSSAEVWGNIHPAGQEAQLTTTQYTIQSRSIFVLIER
jgi:isoamylase